MTPKYVVAMIEESTVFKYIPRPSDDLPDPRKPIFRVRMTHKTSATVLALVDTGSTYSALSKSLANKIGLESKDTLTQINHASGHSKAAKANINSIEILHNNGGVFDTMRDQTMLIVDDLTVCLLGRELSLFKRFDITLSEKRKEMILTRV